jgi:hypothetical protein
MVVYNKGSFIDEEPDRRSVRDSSRDKFFTELGGERLKDPFSLDPEPVAQLKLVCDLIEEALGMHQDDKDALSTMKMLIASSSLSVPAAGVSAMGRPALDAVKLSAWGEFFNLKND